MAGGRALWAPGARLSQRPSVICCPSGPLGRCAPLVLESAAPPLATPAGARGRAQCRRSFWHSACQKEAAMVEWP
eukprot:570401-Alexandrium_andersonii.AAC.1